MIYIVLYENCDINTEDAYLNPNSNFTRELNKFDHIDITLNTWFISSHKTSEHIYDLLVKDLSKKELLFVMQIDEKNRNFHGRLSDDTIQWRNNHLDGRL